MEAAVVVAEPAKRVCCDCAWFILLVERGGGRRRGEEITRGREGPGAGEAARIVSEWFE
jgi:hypothetical protein